MLSTKYQDEADSTTNRGRGEKVWRRSSLLSCSIDSNEYLIWEGGQRERKTGINYFERKGKKVYDLET